jgi:wobble nucleotide-excising tRNase
MNSIQNIEISNHLVFSHTVAPSDFKKYNLFFGFNGSGKTTFSNFFRHLENKKPLPTNESEIIFTLEDGQTINLTTEDQLKLVTVKVLNRDYVQENISGRESQFEAIVIGEDQIQKDTELIALKTRSEKWETKSKNAKDKFNTSKDELNTFLSNNAKSIKDFFSLLPANQYTNYTKINLEKDLTQVRSQTTVDIAENEDALIKSINQQTLPQIEPLEWNLDSPNELREELLAVCQKNVINETIDNLLDETWIKQGLRLHEQNELEQCGFCGNTLSETRKQNLKKHFNQEYELHLKSVNDYKQKIEGYIKTLENLRLPSENDFLSQNQEKFNSLKPTFKSSKTHLLTFYKNTLEIIQEKMAKLNLSYEPSIQITEDLNFIENLQKINQLIDTNNTNILTLEKTKQEAVRMLHDLKVSNLLGDYEEKSNKQEFWETRLSKWNKHLSTLKKHISEKETAFRDALTAETAINDMLEKLMGHRDIQITLKDDSYTLCNASKVPRSYSTLSEGEKTIIAVAYFLASLKLTDLEETIIVIDDPISSLDFNHLFHITNEIINQTKDAKQLFILTHNFEFLRQCRKQLEKKNKETIKYKNVNSSRFRYLGRDRIKILHKVKKQTQTAYYQLGVTYEKESKIESLSSFIKDHETEYHYAFDYVCKASSFSALLEVKYHAMNMGRKVLETFIAFYHPDDKEPLKNKLHMFTDDENLLKRFCHEGSHYVSCNDMNQQIAEVPSVMKKILQIIKKQDEKIYTNMLKASGNIQDPLAQ